MMSARNPSSNSLVVDWDWNLPLDIQPKIGQLPGQNDLVNRLQKPRPKLPMNVNSRFKNLCAYIIFPHPKRSEISAPQRLCARMYFPDNYPLEIAKSRAPLKETRPGLTVLSSCSLPD